MEARDVPGAPLGNCTDLDPSGVRETVHDPQAQAIREPKSCFSPNRPEFFPERHEWRQFFYVMTGESGPLLDVP